MPHQRGPDPAGEEILYGRQVLLEVLRAGRRAPRRLWVADGVRPSGTVAELLQEAGRRGLPVIRRPRAELDRLTRSGNHQGVAMEAGPFGWSDLDELMDVALRASEPPFLLILDHVQDPQNIGSMLRSADAAGVQGVVFARDRACGITPAVVRASSGASEHMVAAQVGNIAETVALLRRRGLACYALENVEGALAPDEVSMTGGVAIVVGGEGEGVGRRVRAACDALVRLPMCGRVGSLNAAVAAAVAMFEVRRQRDRAGGAAP